MNEPDLTTHRAIPMASDAAHAAGNDVDDHTSHVPTYVTIFLVLGFLTILEIFVPDIYSAEWNKTTKMLLLCLLAVVKATLVGLYFMHLKWERPWLKWIALMPAYMAVFTILLMLETVFRAPGA